MVKKYYQPYEQMYKKVDLRTGELIEPPPAPEELHQESAAPQQETFYIPPPRVLEPYQPRPFFKEEPPAFDPKPQQEIEENATSLEEEDIPEMPESISEQDAAAHIVGGPLKGLGDLAGFGGLGLKNLFRNIEMDDLILIGLIIILLLEDGDDMPLVLVLGAILLSGLF